MSPRVRVDARGLARPGPMPGASDLPVREDLPAVMSDWPEPLGVGAPCSGWTALSATPVRPERKAGAGFGSERSERPDRRRHGLPVGLAAGAGALILLGVLSHHSHPGAPVPVSPSPGLAATASHLASASAVGMPIPVGDQPVRPIDIVINTDGHRFPASARRSLASWIDQTQNPGTRIRIADGDRISAPLTPAAWIRDPVPALVPGRETRWLERGAARGRNGALIRLGASGPPQLLSARVRVSSVADTARTLQVRGALASRVARQVMVSADQGYGGLSTPGA